MHFIKIGLIKLLLMLLLWPCSSDGLYDIVSTQCLATPRTGFMSAISSVRPTCVAASAPRGFHPTPVTRGSRITFWLLEHSKMLYLTSHVGESVQCHSIRGHGFLMHLHLEHLDTRGVTPHSSAKEYFYPFINTKRIS